MSKSLFATSRYNQKKWRINPQAKKTKELKSSSAILRKVNKLRHSQTRSTKRLLAIPLLRLRMPQALVPMNNLHPGIKWRQLNMVLNRTTGLNRNTVLNHNIKLNLNMVTRIQTRCTNNR
jgi:hypothetical protein